MLFDLNRNPEQIDESQNDAILGEFISTIEEFKTVETDKYSMRIPEDWVKVNRPEIIENGQRYYPDRYQGVTRENVGRWIDVYIDDIPNLVIDKAVKIEANGAFMRVGSISPQCNSFTELLISGQKEPTPTVWEGISFRCSMTENSNNIAAIESRTESGVRLAGEKTDAKYMFYFSDRGSSQDNTIFQDILNSFQAK